MLRPTDLDDLISSVASVGIRDSEFGDACLPGALGPVYIRGIPR